MNHIPIQYIKLLRDADGVSSIEDDSKKVEEFDLRLYPEVHMMPVMKLFLFFSNEYDVVEYSREDYLLLEKNMSILDNLTIIRGKYGLKKRQCIEFDELYFPSDPQHLRYVHQLHLDIYHENTIYSSGKTCCTIT